MPGFLNKLFRNKSIPDSTVRSTGSGTRRRSRQIVGSVRWGTPCISLGVAVSGSRVYVAAGLRGGFQVIDITDPQNPQAVGSVNMPGCAFDVALSRAHAYVACGDGFAVQVIDITNPRSPQIVGSVNTPGGAYAVAASDTHAYVTDEDSGLQVVRLAHSRVSLFGQRRF